MFANLLYSFLYLEKVSEQIRILIGAGGSVLDGIQYLANSVLNLNQPEEYLIAEPYCILYSVNSVTDLTRDAALRNCLIHLYTFIGLLDRATPVLSDMQYKRQYI